MVKLFDVDGKSVVVKRYKKPNIIQCVSYSFFRKSKAERAYLYAAELQRRGFNTPTGIAFVEIKKCLLLRESYFVSDYCGLPSVMPLLKREDFDCGLAEALAKFLVSLHEKGVLHGDLNLSNILFERGSGGYRFWLIDTNRSRFKLAAGEAMAEDDEAYKNADERERYKPADDGAELKLSDDSGRAELKLSGDNGEARAAADSGGSKLKPGTVNEGARFRQAADVDRAKYEQPTT
ncbi:MAG: lipopolysaccharide kinase InaA family protein, partial [Prevotella sp.]|nr:lipopolysaccharide kinase InaA family protein [Prevotella sp.]